MKNSIENTETPELNDLEQFRIKKGFTPEHVADGMKVSKDFVRYIEAGHFEKLGAPTFLRGHVTNYSKILGLDPALVLNQIPVEFLQHKQILASDAAGASPLARVKKQSNNLGKYAVGTALLGMLSLSFYFVWDKWSLPSGEQNYNGTAGIENQSTGDKKITYSSLIPQVSKNDSIKPEIDENDEVATTTDSEKSNNEATDPGSLDDDSANDLDQFTDDKELESSVLIDPNNESSDVNETLISEYIIKLNLQEQAWVSIKTQDGENIVQDLIGPGIREYQSDEPMHFRIGNAANLQLTINDSAVELDQHTNKNIADFNWPLIPSS